MKIAFLNKYQNKVFRGAETFVYELSKRLSKNHEVDVIVDINYFTLLKNKYDVIIPTNGRWQVIIVRKIAWLTGAKMIVSGQSGMGWDDGINLYTFPNVFIALSSKALNWAKKVNPFVKSVYIPNGVDLERFKNIDSRFKNKTKTILTVGAATKQKRLDLVIKAVAKLSDVNLLIASGGGDLGDEIYDLGIMSLGERFKMISVPFEKMPEVYRVADIFTLPSASSESFGNVLVEAMASGFPVVATDDPVRREIVGNAGILVD
ncbi:MAG: glycosyltransferase family 4 protein, partial [Candidatus Woesebacteria bacterium]|nr:glycosyltransferase family 4 protein [Candidatus Woesebacteria bacterium]